MELDEQQRLGRNENDPMEMVKYHVGQAVVNAERGESRSSVLGSFFQAHQFAILANDQVAMSMAEKNVWMNSLAWRLEQAPGPVDVVKFYGALVEPALGSKPISEGAGPWAAYFASFVASGEEALEWAITAWRGSTNDLLKLASSIRLAQLYRQHGDISEAGRYFKLHVEAAQNLGIKKRLAMALFHHSVFLVNHHMYEDGLQVCEDLRALAGEETNDPFIEGHHLKLQGYIYCQFGQFPLAITHNKRAIPLLTAALPCDTLDMRLWVEECIAHAHVEITEASLHLGDMSAVLQGAEDARKAPNTLPMELSDTEVSVTATIMETALAEGRMDDAEAYAAILLNSKRPQTSAIALRAMSRIAFHYRKGRHDMECLRMINSFMEEAESQYIGRDLRMTLLDHGMHLLNFDKFREAENKVERCLRKFIQEEDNFGGFSSGRIAYMEHAKAAFRAIQCAILQQERPSEFWRAIVWAERERARDLVYGIYHHSGGPSYLKELATFDNDDAEAWSEIKLICELAGEETAFLVFSRIGEYHVAGYLLHKDEDPYAAIMPSDGTMLWSQSGAVERTVCYIMTTEARDLLESFYDLLIYPWTRILSKVKPKRLIIIPTEELSILPFAALYNSREDKFLIQEYELASVPSLRLFKYCELQRQHLQATQPRALVVGNPDNNLVNAEEEANFVADKLRACGYGVELLQKAAAAKDAVVDGLASSDWIHLACHAEVSKEFPNGALCTATSSNNSSAENARTSPGGKQLTERTSLVLLEPGEADGRLTGSSIISAKDKLRAACMVLSACQTGRGQICAEGVLGLSRYSHLAGVPSVVVSLWSVDDHATKELMQSLYNNLGSDMELATALQKAIVNMIEQEDSDIGGPLFDIRCWAPFVISGSPSTRISNKESQ